MGRKFDALLGRKFKTSKFKATVNLAVSRLAVLKNQRQAHLNVARSDIVQLLNLDHHEHALLRVDQMVKEQNMLDVYVMLDGYCHLLLQMVNLIEQEKDCPDELKEAASSLLFAAPRCGKFPELQEIRAILTARYGKDFAYGAIELRNNCGVSTRMIQKLSSRQSSLETRMKILTEIATENNIILKLEDSSPVPEQGAGEVKNNVSEKSSSDLGNEFDDVMIFTESRKGKKTYRDVEDAAQAAFVAAEYAASAARAAVELSRSRSFGSDNLNSPNSRPRKVLDKSTLEMRYEKTPEPESEPEDDVINVEILGEIPKNIIKDNDGSELNRYTPLENKVVFYEGDNENGSKPTRFFSSKQLEFDVRKTEPRFDQEMKMQEEVHQLDLSRMPISVRTKRVYRR